MCRWAVRANTGAYIKTVGVLPSGNKECLVLPKEESMSMLRKAKDQLRDRIKPQGVRTGLRNSSRIGGAGGGSHAKPKTGVSLQYKSLQPDPEFEAVLDDIHTSSNPLFAISDVPVSKAPNVSQPIDRKSKGTGKRSVGRVKSAANSESFFPASDEEEGDMKDQHATGIDPLLGQTLIPETDSGHTDSDESEDQLELDPETVNVLESLHLADKVQDELFGSASPSSSLDHDSREHSSEREGGANRDVVGGRHTTDNESGNNYTTVLLHSLEETGETLPLNEPALTSRQPGSDGIPIVISSNANSSQRDNCGLSKSVDKIRPPSPSLDDLLEHGSAALRSHSDSPLLGSPHSPHASPHSSPLEFSPSPLTSSNETETNELFYSVTNQLYPHAASNSKNISPAEAQILIDSRDQTHINSKEIDSSRRMDTGEKVILDEATIDDSLFAESTAHRPSPIDIAPEKQVRRNLCVEGKDELGLSPASDHPLSHSDDGEEGEVKEKVYTTKSHVPDSEDELFPDDAKHMQDFVAREKSNTLDIKEDYFSSTPGEQRKKMAPPRPSPPAPYRQNSSGKVAPPRPPRSPQLKARLIMRRTQPKAKSPVPPSTQTPAIERARVSPAKSLDSVPTSTAANTSVKPPKIASHENQEMPLLESPDSSVDPPPLATVTTESHKAVVTSQQEDVGLDDEAAEVFTEPAFFPLHIHLLLVGVLYIYYSFNPFVYLAGLMAGFLTFYLLLGAVFVLYVQNEEEVAASCQSPIPELSPDFMKSMSVRLEDYKNRFTVSLCTRLSML